MIMSFLRLILSLINIKNKVIILNSSIFIKMQSFCFFGSPKEVGYGAKAHILKENIILFLIKYICLGIY